MTIHRATYDRSLPSIDQPDVALMLQRVDAFTEANVTQFINSEVNSLWIDDEDGIYCRAHVNHREQLCVVVDLLPEIISLGRRFRVLIPAVADLAARFPEAAEWWIHAAFPDGVNRLGQKDGGELSVKTARDIFGQIPGPNPLVSKLKDRDVWQIGWKLKDAAEKLLLIADRIPDYELAPEVGTWPST